MRPIKPTIACIYHAFKTFIKCFKFIRIWTKITCFSSKRKKTLGFHSKTSFARSTNFFSFVKNSSFFFVAILTFDLFLICRENKKNNSPTNLFEKLNFKCQIYHIFHIFAKDIYLKMSFMNKLIKHAPLNRVFLRPPYHKKQKKKLV